MRHFVREIVTTVKRIHDTTGRQVPLVGWSLGGVVSREVARQVPELIEQVITLGSPVIRSGQRMTNVAVLVTAIYTKADGIVPWKSSIDRVDPNVDHVEVRSTHLGLGVHHAVFVEIAQRLHSARRRRDAAGSTADASVSRP